MEKAQTIACGNKIHRPLLDENLTNYDLRVAMEELNETSDVRQAALELLRSRIKEQIELDCRTDDAYLLRFLRCRKFDLDRAFQSVLDHFEFRRMHPKIFPSPAGVEEALRAGIFNFLPHRDHKGRAIYVVRVVRWDPDRVPYADLVAAGNLVAEYLLDNPVTQINGYIGIWDYRGFSFKQFTPFCSPKHLMLLTTLMQDRFPARFKIAFSVNCSSLVNIAWSLFKPLMKEKFKQRIKIFGTDMKDLHEYVDPCILPTEYGGSITAPEDQQIIDWILDQEHNSKSNKNGE